MLVSGAFEVQRELAFRFGRVGQERRHILQPLVAHLGRDPHVLDQRPAINDELRHGLVEQHSRGRRQAAVAYRNVERADKDDAFLELRLELGRASHEAHVLRRLPAKAGLADQFDWHQAAGLPRIGRGELRKQRTLEHERPFFLPGQ